VFLHVPQLEPFNHGALLYGMSNKTFLAIVGAILIALIGSLMIRKYEDCAERGGKACPTSRYGGSMDPYQGQPIVRP